MEGVVRATDAVVPALPTRLDGRVRLAWTQGHDFRSNESLEGVQPALERRETADYRIPFELLNITKSPACLLDLAVVVSLTP